MKLTEGKMLHQGKKYSNKKPICPPPSPKGKECICDQALFYSALTINCLRCGGKIDW